MQIAMNDEEEEEKEVDPSLVGSLDNVYTEEPGTMPGEDPFKRVPMIVDKEKPSNLMEMEKTLEAMEASIDQESSQELDSSDDMSSLDMSGMIRRPRAHQVTTNSEPSLNRVDEGAGEHRDLNQVQRALSDDTEDRRTAATAGNPGTGNMPDLLTGRAPTTTLDLQLSSQVVPDVAAHVRNPLAAAGGTSSSGGGLLGGGGGGPVDLLHNTNTASMGPHPTTSSSSSPSSSAAVVTQPLDLTDGLLGLRVGSGEGET